MYVCVDRCREILQRRNQWIMILLLTGVYIWYFTLNLNRINKSVITFEDSI